MFEWIRKIPVVPLAIMSVLLGLAPFNGEPHLLQKLSMLSAGELTRPLDIFDLFLHSAPLVILILRLTIFTPHPEDRS